MCDQFVMVEICYEKLYIHRISHQVSQELQLKICVHCSISMRDVDTYAALMDGIKALDPSGIVVQKWAQRANICTGYYDVTCDKAGNIVSL